MAGIDIAYVHIGLHKTGSTSIQRAFARHRRMLLERHGVIYPSVASNHSGPLHSMFCRNPDDYVWNIVQGTSASGRVAEQNRAFAESLAADLALPGRCLVVSGEDLSRLGARGVELFRRWIAPQVGQVRIVAYVREPVAWATSHAQQQVRKGRTLEALLDLRLAPRFRRCLQPWLAAFGGEAMRVFDFDLARGEEEGLVGHFARVVGLPPAAYRPMLSIHANESFSAEAVALLSALNAAKPRFVDKKVSADRGREVEALFARIKGARFTLPAEIAARTQAEAAEEVAWLAETFDIVFAPARSVGPAGALFASAEARESLALLLWEVGRQGQGALPPAPRLGAEPPDPQP